MISISGFSTWPEAVLGRANIQHMISISGFSTTWPEAVLGRANIQHMIFISGFSTTWPETVLGRGKNSTYDFYFRIFNHMARNCILL